MTTHDDRRANELAIFTLRHEPGLQEIRTWLFWKRDDITDRWTELEGNDLLKLQGEARLVKKMIKMIDQGPTIIPRGEA
jgi:hypothetical protein